jgi:FkbM family methyltransferase
VIIVAGCCLFHHTAINLLLFIIYIVNIMPSTITVIAVLVLMWLIFVAQLKMSSVLMMMMPPSSLQHDEQDLPQLLQQQLETLQRDKQNLEQKVHAFLGNKNSTQHDDDLMHSLSSQVQQLQQSQRLFQLRVNAWMNWNSDPYLGSAVNYTLCRNSTTLVEYGCNKKDKCPGSYDHPVCLDHLLPPLDCIVYDFGIRENPEFGKTLLGAPFYCKVYAFDPSPITREFYASPKSAHLRNHPNYTLFHYGAGGVDGSVRLNEYDWGQVSIIRFPLEIQKNCSASGNCALDFHPYQLQTFMLPVKTLDTIMKELGHDHVDILKLDVEGSEYAFLEHALEHDNLRNVSQLSVEWHHYDFDSRYGGGSVSSINAIVALLQEQGLHQFYIHDDIGGWPGTGRDYWEKGITLRYNLASFMRI